MPLSDPTARPPVPKFVRPIILALLAGALGMVLVVVARQPSGAPPARPNEPPHGLVAPPPAQPPTRPEQPAATAHSPQTPKAPAPPEPGFALNPPPADPAIQPISYLEPGIGPVSFYMAKCASCHGAYGSYYYENDILMEGRGQIAREGLLSQVRLMAETNAQVLLSDPQLEPLVAYVSTFPDVADTDVAVDGPFIAFTGWSSDGVLSGEVTPDSSVSVEVQGGEPVRATVTEHQWSATLNPGADLTKVVVVATLGGREVRLHLNKGAFAIPK